jgi:NhaP-type Na+/H+ or K+/H+ antiporter
LKADSYAAQDFLLRGDLGFFIADAYNTLLLLAAVVVLAAALVPRLSAEKFMTAPLIFMTAGLLVFLLPLNWELPDLVEDAWIAKRLTELGVIIALTSAGLKINKPFSWKSWQISWRLLAFTMPLTIAAAALLGWWALGMLPAAALLFGAAIAPTDPVLAADVQTTAPGAPDTSHARVALTTEAGLNDGLAFPFTNLAIAVALAGVDPAGWFAGWLLMDVFYKIALGILIGTASGWLLGRLLFGLPVTDNLARTMTGSIALSLTLLPYALAELASSYGFIAVFVAACVFRQQESQHEYQQILHDFSEEIEHVLIAVLMFLIGAYVATGALATLSWPMFAVAMATVFLIRPLAGLVALAGCTESAENRLVVAFYGIRGIGSFYYVAYALDRADFPQAHTLWALVILIVVISVLVHGVTATRAMAFLDRQRAARTPASERLP